MRRMPMIEPIAGLPVDTQYDGYIGVIGYEKRSRYAAEKVADKALLKMACGFTTRRVLSYNKNLAWHRRAGFDVNETSDADYGKWIVEVIDRMSANSSGTVRLCVDISSTSRLRLAILIENLLLSNASCDFYVDFLYSFANDSSGIQETVVTSAGPVTEMFAGWAGDPESPLAAVFGLGYERDKALGVLEFLEPGEVWAFEPRREDAAYGRLIKRANVSFYSGLSPGHIIGYPVKCPFESFRQVETFIYGIMRRCRVILLPFGPKPFALISLLVASIHYPEVSVWRVTGEDSELATDRIPSGEIVGLRAVFRRPEGEYKNHVAGHIDRLAE